MRSLLLNLVLIIWIPLIASGQNDQLDSLEQDTTTVLKEHSEEADRLSEELEFSSYLVSNELYDEAEQVLLKLQAEFDLEEAERDSIDYLLGSLHYYRQEFLEAIKHFSSLGTTGDIQVKGAFMKAMCEVEIAQLDSAKATLTNIPIDSTSSYGEFRAFMLEGIALLQRDYGAFDSLRSGYAFTNYRYRQEQENFLAYYDEMSSYKRKSPFLAGLISAIIPGLGKFYAGYRGLPFGTMFMTIPLAAVAVESLIIGGLLSPPFIAFGAIFSVFYVGAIWGSVLSVNAIQEEIYAQFDHNIRFDMHLPLRRIL